jgi:uncharacterized membrane protein (DUF485 family)
MSAPTGQPTTERAQAPADTQRAVDWRGIAETPEFMELHRSRRRFTLVGMAIETGALLVVMALYGAAPDTMGKPAIGSITWALLSGAALVVLTFVMAIAYERRARGWEERAAHVLEHAEPMAEPARRFAR